MGVNKKVFRPEIYQLFWTSYRNKCKGNTEAPTHPNLLQLDRYDIQDNSILKEQQLDSTEKNIRDLMQNKWTNYLFVNPILED